MGEIRGQGDRRTIAIQSALTEALAVQHASHQRFVREAITRLLDMKVGKLPSEFHPSGRSGPASGPRVICPVCKTQYHPEERLVKSMGLAPEEAESTAFYRGEGCDHCRNTGFKGRIAIFEYLPVDEKDSKGDRQPVQHPKPSRRRPSKGASCHAASGRMGQGKARDHNHIGSLESGLWKNRIMPVFSYKASDMEGKIVKGFLEACDDVDVASKLDSMGYIPDPHQPCGKDQGRIADRHHGSGGLGPGPHFEQGTSCCSPQDLATLLEAGLPVDRVPCHPDRSHGKGQVQGDHQGHFEDGPGRELLVRRLGKISPRLFQVLCEHDPGRRGGAACWNRSCFAWDCFWRPPRI